MEKQGDTITMWFSFLYLLRIFSVLDLQIAKQIFADFRFFSTSVSTWKIIYVSPASYLLCIVFPIKTPPVNMRWRKREETSQVMGLPINNSGEKYDKEKF